MRFNARPMLWSLVGMLALMLCAPSIVQAQSMEYLNRGKLWDGVVENGGSGMIFNYQKIYERIGLAYPGMLQLSGSYGARSTKWYQSSGQGVWILLKDGGTYEVYSSGGPRYNSDGVHQVDYPADQKEEQHQGYDNQPISDDPSLLETHGLPSFVQPNYWAGVAPPSARPVNIHNWTYGEYATPDKDSYGEQVVVAHWQAGPILGTRKGRVWSHPDYDDFIIYELTFENVGDKPLNDTYFAMNNIFRPAQPGHIFTGGYPLWYAGTNTAAYDDHYKYTGSPSYVGPPGVSAEAIAKARMSYSYDGDYPLSPHDDRGEPLVKSREDPRYPPQIDRPEGTLLSAAYIGFATIDADPTDGFAHEPDAASKYVAPKVAEQPTSANWYQVRNRSDYDDPHEAQHSDEQMYDMITTSTPADPTEVSAYAHTQAWGPYDLAPGEKAKVVTAYVAAQASGHDKYKDQVQPYDWYWMFEGKKDEIDLGEEVLFKHLERAQNAYELDYNVPNQPPDVYFEIRSNADGNFTISWSGDAMDARDPDYTGAEAQDIAGFRVYVSRQAFFGPWDLAAEVKTDPVSGPVNLPDGVTYDGATNFFSWTDTESLPGFAYWYIVRAFDKGHDHWTGANGKTLADLPPDVQDNVRMGLEGGHSSQNQISYHNGVRPVVISSSAFDRMEVPITVVPNPFHLTDAGGHYKASKNMRFTGVPRHARISIYSISGNLIVTKIHNNASQGEAVWNQNTMHSGSVTERLGSGVYFWVVESLVPGSEGKTQTGTLMIIR